MDERQEPALMTRIAVSFALVAIIGGMSHAGTKGELKTHLDKLRDEKKQNRFHAMHGLWDMASAGRGVEVAVPAIIAAVADGDPELRGLACHFLIIFGNTLPGANIGELRSAIFPLTRALSDEDKTVRGQAVFALGSIAGRLSKERDVAALLPLWYAVDRLDEIHDQDDDFKRHAKSIKQAYELLKSHSDEMTEDAGGD